jgi:hypothetical protein
MAPKTRRNGAPRRHFRVPVTYRPDLGDRMEPGSPMAQAVRAIRTEIENDLGGAATLSHGKRTVIRQIAHLEVVLAFIDAKVTGGILFDLDQKLQLVNVLMGLYSRIGMERKVAAGPRLADVWRDSIAPKPAPANGSAS